AVGRCIGEVSRYTSRLRQAVISKDVTAIHLNGEWLTREADFLATASEVLSTLIGGTTRNNITITNHKVEEEV
ncbi:hypothetical protein LCGC14_1868910, partial [marine sediment metagenome]